MSDLEEMAARMRLLGSLDERAAQIAAPLVVAALKATAAAGTTPEGEAWAPTKSGGRAMANAAAHVSGRAVGDVVLVTLSGPDAIHNFGRGKTEPRRQVIPDNGGPVPDVVKDALDRAVSQAFGELT